MYRNQYDTDVSTWSPQGRLYQVEYAVHAVRQGSACVGIVSKDFAVLSSLKRQAGELASHQRKVFRIDDHMGIAIAGLTADARVLARYMRTECMNHKYVYESPMQIGRLVEQVADKHQRCTQQPGQRPYGVGLLVAGYDRTGPHLFETSPAGTYMEYKALSIGSRSQSAKTYLGRIFEQETNGFDDMDADTLIKHAVRALKGCVVGDQELNSQNVSVAIIGKERSFEMIEGDTLMPYLKAAMEGEQKEEKDEGKDDGMDTSA